MVIFVEHEGLGAVQQHNRDKEAKGCAAGGPGWIYQTELEEAKVRGVFVRVHVC